MTRPLSPTAAAALDSTPGRRQLRGTLFRYGEEGLTSAGPLRVRPGAIQLPEDLSTVPLVRDHDATAVRGHLAVVDDTAERMYVVLQVDDGTEGDAALADAEGPGRARAGLSYYIDPYEVDAEGWVVKGVLSHIGQVAEPAYNSGRIDAIAAAMNPGASRSNNNPGGSMTPEQIARLAELRNQATRTPEEETELAELVNLALDQVAAAPEAAAEPAPAAPAQPVAAAEPAPAEPPAQPVAAAASVPAGNVPSLVRPAATTQPQGNNHFERMITGLVQAFESKKRGGNPMPGISAALNDVTSTAHTSDIEPLGWSGELFSGVAYESVFSQHLSKGDLTNWKGQGWRFTQTPSIQDYAGDKAAIPTGSVGTEEQLYEAARGAVGIDVDRKYFDFPNGEFLASLFQAIAETWEMLVDDKSGLFIVSEAVEVTKPVTVATTSGDATVTAPAGKVVAADIGRPITGAGIPASTTVLSITNSTTFEMSANATVTATGVSAQVGQASASLLKAAARLAMSLKRRYNGTKAPTSTGPDYLYVNDNDWFGMLDLTELELPAYLSAFGISPETFIPTEDVPAGFIIGGVDKAAKLRTESRSPIVVDALNLANGGIDKAFYGYWAIEQQHLRGIQKASYAAVVEA